MPLAPRAQRAARRCTIESLSHSSLAVVSHVAQQYSIAERTREINRHRENFWDFITGPRRDFGPILLILNVVVHRSLTGLTHFLVKVQFRGLELFKRNGALFQEEFYPPSIFRPSFPKKLQSPKLHFYPFFTFGPRGRRARSACRPRGQNVAAIALDMGQAHLWYKKIIRCKLFTPFGH